jgi:hypothetical protein
MCEIVIKQYPKEYIDKYNVQICDPTWGDKSSPRWKKCHGVLAILANRGMEDYSVDLTLIRKSYVYQDGNLAIETETGKQPLWYNSWANSYTEVSKINLNVGLNVLFWCSQKLKPRVHCSEEDRLRYSTNEHLWGGTNLQITPGTGQVWDTYLLREGTKGFSGKSDATPISEGEAPFFATDRITIARKANEPSQLLQQTWMKAIRERVRGKREFEYYQTRHTLPIHQVPMVAQTVSYFHLIKLENPKVGGWSQTGPFMDTA